MILFCYACRRRSILLNLCSVTGIILLYFFCLVRMVVPMEFPWTIPVSGGGIYNHIYQIIHRKLFGISVAHLFVGIWLAGIFVFLLSYFIKYYKAVVYFGRMKPSTDPDVRAAFRKVCGKTESRIAVIQTPAAEIPCCMGMIQQRILLPDKPYTEQELYYILLHEYNHLHNHDIFLMQLVNILCILFWWNPCIYLLKKDVNQNMEIRCDQMVVKRISKEERADYLAVILKEFQDTLQGRRTGYVGVAQLLEQHGSGMIERFEKVAGTQKTASKKGTIALCTIAVFILVISYTWILQPYYEAPHEDYGYEQGETRKVDVEEAYIYKKKGQYYVHCEQGDLLIEDKKHLEMLQKSGFEIKEETE